MAHSLVNPPVNPLVNPLENNREKVFRKVTNNNSTGSVDRSEYRDSKSTDNKKKKTNTELKIYSCNVRSINNKRKSIDEMLHTVQPDVAFFSEINCNRSPVFKGFHSFNLYSKKKFHGISVVVGNHLKGSVLRVPYSTDLELIHLINKDTTP